MNGSSGENFSDDFEEGIQPIDAVPISDMVIVLDDLATLIQAFLESGETRFLSIATRIIYTVRDDFDIDLPKSLSEEFNDAMNKIQKK